MTLTYELDLVRIEEIHHAEYLRQRSFYSKVVVRTDAHTHTLDRLHNLNHERSVTVLVLMSINSFGANLNYYRRRDCLKKRILRTTAAAFRSTYCNRNWDGCWFLSASSSYFSSPHVLISGEFLWQTTDWWLALDCLLYEDISFANLDFTGVCE